MLLEAKPHRKRYDGRIYRSQKTKAKYSPRIYREIGRTLVELMGLEVKKQKEKND